MVSLYCPGGRKGQNGCDDGGLFRRMRAHEMSVCERKMSPYMLKCASVAVMRPDAASYDEPGTTVHAVSVGSTCVTRIGVAPAPAAARRAGSTA
jgi:hypothetical protein